jgi:hypothetical protein
MNNTDQQSQLIWKRANRDISTTYESSIGLTEDDDFRREYQRRLGFEYNETLTSNGTETGNLYGKQKHELFFVTTFADLNLAFVVTSEGKIGWRDDNTFYRHMDGTYLVLPIPSDTEINLRFGEKFFRYSLKIEAFDSVQLLKRRCRHTLNGRPYRSTSRCEYKQNDSGSFGSPRRSRGHVGIISKKHSRRGNEAIVSFVKSF